MIRERYFYFVKSNICYWAEAIKFCYYKLSSDSGKQVKGWLCIVSPKQMKQAVETEGGPRKVSLALSWEQFLLFRTLHLRKMKTKKSCKSTKMVLQSSLYYRCSPVMPSKHFCRYSEARESF